MRGRDWNKKILSNASGAAYYLLDKKFIRNQKTDDNPMSKIKTHNPGGDFGLWRG